MDSRVERTPGKAAACGPGEVVDCGVGWARQGSSWRAQRGWGSWSRQSHIHVQINREEQLGSKADCPTQGSSAGK